MIYDQLDRISTYKGLHPNIDKVIAFLEEASLADLDLGRVDIDGDEVFLYVQDNELNQTPTDVFEYHKSYMDIHLIAEGLELIRYGRLVKEETQAFTGDIGFVRCEKTYDFDLDGSNFIAFYPDEPHQPNQFLSANERVRKYVFKVKII